MSGRVVETRSLGTLSEGEYETAVSSVNWPSGIYLVTLRDGKGGFTSKKIVRSAD
ncbi:MAG: T9SS type A sorting domain-containing protein [Bacteroidota bacterium]